MAAPKGHKKWGGRAKGTPNKINQSLVDMAEKLGVDPFNILLLFAKNDWQTLGYKKPDAIDPNLRARCAQEASKYLYAQRRSIEHSGEVEVDHPKINEESLEDRVKKHEGKQC